MKLLIVFVVALLSGCASDKICLPMLPAWEQPTDTRIINPAQIAAGVAKVAPGAHLHYTDDSYSFISYSWLEKYLSWTWEAATVDGLSYHPQSFDCEDFANGFSFFATRAAARAKLTTAPLIARIVVEQTRDFANTKGMAGLYHGLIAVATDRGVYVVEPQPDAGPFRLKTLKDYPNRIVSVVLGDCGAQ